MYEVTTDLAVGRITFRIAGGLSPDDAPRLAAAIREAVLKTQTVCGSFDMLADMREAVVMAQDSSKIGEDTMAWCASQQLRKCATVTTGAVLKMQARRVNPFANHRIFTSRDDALRWLDASAEGRIAVAAAS